MVAMGGGWICAVKWKGSPALSCIRKGSAYIELVFARDLVLRAIERVDSGLGVC